MSKRGAFVVNNPMLKQFLQDRHHKSEYSSVDRIQRQIIDFTNSYLTQPLFVMKNIVAAKKKVRVQMPEKSMQKLNEFVKAKIEQNQEDRQTDASRKVLAKYLGKNQLTIVHLTPSLCVC